VNYNCFCPANANPCALAVLLVGMRDPRFFSTFRVLVCLFLCCYGLVRQRGGYSNTLGFSLVYGQSVGACCQNSGK
jgi:hypothetical protein